MKRLSIFQFSCLKGKLCVSLVVYKTVSRKKAAFKKFSFSSVYCFAIMMYTNKKKFKIFKKLMAT